MIKEQEIFNSILTNLKDAKFSADFEVINYWQAQPTEQRVNHLFFRDYEAFFKRQNQQHEVTLLIEFTAVIFAEKVAILGTTILQELIQLIGGNRSWGLNGVTTELSKWEKHCETQGAYSCEIVLEVMVKYKTNSFYIE